MSSPAAPLHVPRSGPRVTLGRVVVVAVTASAIAVLGAVIGMLATGQQLKWCDGAFCDRQTFAPGSALVVERRRDDENGETGLRTRWHRNGALAELTGVRRDLREGCAATWTDDGKLATLGRYRGDRREGSFIQREDGALVERWFQDDVDASARAIASGVPSSAPCDLPGAILDEKVAWLMPRAAGVLFVRGRPEDEVLRELASRAPELARCARRSPSVPSAGARATLSLLLFEDGGVKQAELAMQKDATLRRCVRAALAGLRFAPQKSETVAEVPLAFVRDAGRRTGMESGTLVIAIPPPATDAPTRLLVDTNVRVRVFIDGKPLGWAPGFAHAVAPGIHKLTLDNRKNGYLDERILDVPRGEETALSLELGSYLQ